MDRRVEELEKRVSQLEKHMLWLLHPARPEQSASTERGSALMSRTADQASLAEARAHEVHERVQALRAEVKSMERRLDQRRIGERDRP